jgi:hypothetical protein
MAKAEKKGSPAQSALCDVGSELRGVISDAE